MTAANRMEETMTDPLEQARQARVLADLQPVTDALSKVRAALDDYERSARGRAQLRVTHSLLAALGQHDPTLQAPPAENETAEAEAVLTAFDALRAFLLPTEDGPSIQEIVETAAPGGLVEALAVTPACAEERPATEPARTLSQKDKERAEALLDEVARLVLGWQDQPKMRLSFLLRAIAAEARDLLRTIPHAHTLYWRLEGILSKLLAVRNEAGIEDFIKGLSRSSKEDWTRLANGYRNAVSRFDRDAAAPLSTHRTPPKPGVAKMGDVLGAKLKLVAPIETQPARWPFLRDALAGKPLLIVGGVALEERMRAIEQHTGLQIDWREVDRGSPRQVASIADTISKGSAVACVIVEGFLAHKDWWPIQTACKQSDTPYAMGDRAGAPAIERALDTLERYLVSPPPPRRRSNS